MARRSFRRRGSAGRWFPFVEGFSSTQTLVVEGNGDATIEATALIASGLDDQPNTVGALATETFTLNDAVNGTGYFVKRIVGQLIATVDPVDNSDIITNLGASILLLSGIAVLDTDELGQPNNLSKYQYFADEWGATMQRWVWQRLWKLNVNGNRTWDSQYPTTVSLTYNTFPASNIAYGDVRSGPHLDVKTKCLVRPDQRLFMVHQTRLLGGGENEVDRTIAINHNLRGYATMRRNLKFS